MLGLDWAGAAQIRPTSVSFRVLRGGGVVVLVRAARWLASTAVTGGEVGEQRRDGQGTQGGGALRGVGDAVAS